MSKSLYACGNCSSCDVDVKKCDTNFFRRDSPRVFMVLKCNACKKVTEQVLELKVTEETVREDYYDGIL